MHTEGFCTWIFDYPCLPDSRVLRGSTGYWLFARSRRRISQSCSKCNSRGSGILWKRLTRTPAQFGVQTRASLSTNMAPNWQRSDIAVHRESNDRRNSLNHCHLAQSWLDRLKVSPPHGITGRRF